MNYKKSNAKILILVGPPGAGKTTFSKEFIALHKNWARVCRDDYREMQSEEVNSNNQIEKMVNILVDASIEALLKKNINVIIDATHCRKDYINQYVKKFGHLADISFKVFDVPLQELEKRCEEREAQTGKHIPKTVIRKMFEDLENLKKNFSFSPIPKTSKHFQLLEQDISKPTAYLCDLDGTIALANGRSMFNPSEEDVMNDSPIEAVIKVLQSLQSNHTIIYLSGREDSTYNATKRWIEQYVYNGQEQDLKLYMRASGDYRRDSIVKKEILHTHILPQYHVLGAFDDRLQVVRECWNAEGIFCFNVNQTLEEF